APEAEVRRNAREVFRNVARYYVDLIRLPLTPPQTLLEEQVRIHGLENLTEPMKQGRGVVVVTAHFGNPEVAVQVGPLLGIDVLVLAEPLRPPMFARLMRQIRGTFGPRYMDVGFGAIAEALRHLRAGGCLAITCDRDIQGRGALLPFFGVLTRMPTGAIDIALRTNALVVPGYCLRAPDSCFDIHFEEPLDLVVTGDRKRDEIENTKALLKRVEGWIRAHPGQWMPLERIWKPLDRRQAPPPASARPPEDREQAATMRADG
ncbi:MAG TPA: lysophospholipid acyltransferase family protein, partial [Dehalococcoidia bacterium]|nr:lysophospholipid acyltransferase family protein [Dehalococcoidia bacterium]